MMLKVNQSLISDDPNQKPVGPKTTAPRNYYLRVLRHQRPTVIVFFTLILALTILYLIVATPIFIATSYLVLDTHQMQLLQDPQEALHGGGVTVDSGLVSSQIQLLKSPNVSRAVIKQLNLTEDREFTTRSFMSRVWGFINNLGDLFTPAGPPLTEEENRERILSQVQDKFEDYRTITRVEQSYVIEIDAQSQDRNKSAKIANTIADAYIDDLLQAKFEETKRANVWLQARLAELRTQVAAEQLAVIEFRKKNNFAYSDTEAGKHYIDTPGRLVNEQQLSELNSQLILAQANTAQMKSRYERIQEVMKQDVPDASVTEALNDQVIIKLRADYLDKAARAAYWAQRYGPNHLAVVALQTQMRETLRAIKDEMAKIEQSAKSDYEIALQREQSLQASVTNAMSQSQLSNQTQIELQELESKAQTSRAMHDSFLQHYIDTMQQQSFPITESRIVGPAFPPLVKTYPKTWLVLLLAVFGGAVISFAVGALREVLDLVFRSAKQVEEELGVDCLAMLPELKTNLTQDAAGPQQLTRQIFPTQQGRIREQPMLSIVLDAPFSQYSEALRSVKVASDLSAIVMTKKVTGFISTLPGEGKSTVSANYAELIAHAGTRALLIDADLRNPTLSVKLGGEGIGLIDVLAGWKTVDEAMLIDTRSGLRFLPAGSKPNMPHTNELLASEAMKKLVTALQDSFDYIVLDLPPLIPIVDARVATNFVDSFICVVQWGSTKIEFVKHALLDAPELYDRLLGVILNKVDMQLVRRFESYRHNYYYEKYRARYSSPDPAANAAARQAKEPAD